MRSGWGRRHRQAARGTWSLRSSAPPSVYARVLIFGAFAALLCGNGWTGHHHSNLEVGLAPYEVAGAALGLLLVLRTNAGYDRWWEGRKLWGALVNTMRTLTRQVLTMTADAAGKREFLDMLVAFTYAMRDQLRGDTFARSAELLPPAPSAQPWPSASPR